MVPAFDMVIVPQNLSTENGQIPGWSGIISVAEPPNSADAGYPSLPNVTRICYARRQPAHGTTQDRRPGRRDRRARLRVGLGCAHQILHAKNNIAGRIMPF